ncbi:hypothetical protein VULLAG_LOCUS9312 [Vulpes lagopus]
MAAATLRDSAQEYKQWIQYPLSSRLSFCEARAIYTILILEACRAVTTALPRGPRAK